MAEARKREASGDVSDGCPLGMGSSEPEGDALTVWLTAARTQAVYQQQ